MHTVLLLSDIPEHLPGYTDLCQLGPKDFNGSCGVKSNLLLFKSWAVEELTGKSSETFLVPKS